MAQFVLKEYQVNHQLCFSKKLLIINSLYLLLLFISEQFTLGMFNNSSWKSQKLLYFVWFFMNKIYEIEWKSNVLIRY